MSARPKLVLLGMMSKFPVPGVVWQTAQYLVGFERLGFDVYYVEAHGRTPSMLMDRETDDGSARAAACIDDMMRRFGLAGRWAYHALHDDSRFYGLDEAAVNRLYRDAALIVNLHGSTIPTPEHAATGRLLYLETDPVELQIELHDGLQAAIDFLEPHYARFSFGENYGSADCALPVSERFPFKPTRQPIVLDAWEPNGHVPGAALTTIGNWRQSWRDVRLGDETYTWSKHHEFLKFLDLPAQSGRVFELALSSLDDDDRRLLERNGWRVRDVAEVSRDVDTYRDYIMTSRGEWTVAKDQNVRFRTGWFSDRSAAYLASGRPVVTQDTGFSNVLPTGEGLFAFSTRDDILDALERIDADYERHSRAARRIAQEFFSYDVVLGRLLEEAGVR
jgi:hypothetical protein